MRAADAGGYEYAVWRSSKKIIKEKGLTQKEVATMAGYDAQGALANMLRKPNITLMTALKILNALGYSLAIVKQDEVSLSFLELPENARRKPKGTHTKRKEE